MTTVGMNYEIREGKEGAFEKKFAAVLEVMKDVPGHVRTKLYRDVFSDRLYLVVSEWAARKDFDGFVGSDVFRATTAWGEANILASRPNHFIYGEESAGALAGDCPAHTAQPV